MLATLLALNSASPLDYLGRKLSYVAQHFWAPGYFVSTVGRDEATVRGYIAEQEEEDERQDQLICGTRSRTGRLL